MKANLYYAGLLATILLVFVASGPSTFATITESTQSPETIDQTQTSQEGVVTVAVGEGSNGTFQNYTYAPQTVEINAGESVTWFSPVDPALPVDIHTVTFANPSIVSDLILPFAVPNEATNFELLPPFNAGEPVLIPTPDGRQAIVGVNKLAFYPAVVGANNQTTYLNGTDIQYTTDGTDTIVNSGIILPTMPPTGGPEPNSTGTETGDAGVQSMGPPFPLVSSFSLTFQEPGAYPYFCAIHPWMVGQVIVRGESQTETLGQNQTETLGQNQTETLGQNQTETLGQNQTETLGQNEAEAPNPIFE
jgi:plastocyanin